MKNVLLIVDPQNDFITGTLAVAGAKTCIAKLSEYIENKGHEYDYIYITMDTHPVNHSSFTENGGIWPAHCIKDTNGWRIWGELELALRGKSNVSFFFKGTKADTEEYSIFDNSRDGAVLEYRLTHLSEITDELYVDVCGIAGDYCVLETLKGLVNIVDPKAITILEDFTASIDGGEKLTQFAAENNITFIKDAHLNLESYGNN